MTATRASVAMAVYNGEKYISEQVDSILELMGDEDELVISYDPCSDRTVEIIEQYAEKDKRVKIFRNELKPGVSGNFTNAAMKTRGKYILFSDQDDLWLNDKINRVVNEAELTGADLVIHNGRFADAQLKPYGESLFELTKASASPLKNFYKGRFLGCCMCFKREALRYVLPFPDDTSDYPHDIFATIMVGIKGKIHLLDEICIYHRMYDGNATPKTRNGFAKILKNRCILFKTIVKRLCRREGVNL